MIPGLLCLHAKLKVAHVPNKSVMVAVLDLMSGDVDMVIGTKTSVAQFLDTGRLKPETLIYLNGLIGAGDRVTSPLCRRSNAQSAREVESFREISRRGDKQDVNLHSAPSVTQFISSRHAMQDFPHHYKVVSTTAAEGLVSVAGDKLGTISCAAPAEFGGPGDQWSPETLLTAAVGSCFILSFRAIARASKLAWISLTCEVEGTLERREGKTKFTEFAVHATLSVPQDTNEERAVRLLEKAEASCLVTNSLTGTTHLDATVLKTP